MAYRMDLGPYERLDIAARYTFDSTPGMVSSLQDLYNLSRGNIHAIVAKALEGFKPNKPGPKPDPLGKLWAQIAALEAQNKALKDRATDLEQKLSQSVIIDQRRLEDFILTALVTPPSHEGISNLVATAYGEKYRPSVGKISQLNRHYGTVAGLILLDERLTSHFKDALADEIFFCGAPTLVVTEFYSTAIGAIELSASRDGDSWKRCLERFRNLSFLASDLAKGLRKGLQLLPWMVNHQGDNWHLFREVQRLTRKLEATTSQLFQEEDKARQQLQKGKIYRPTMEKVEAKVGANLEWMETYYQAVEGLVDAFNPVVDEQPAQPHLRTRAEAQAQLDQVIAALRGLPDRRVDKLVKELNGRRECCSAFLDRLQDQIDALPVKFRSGISSPLSPSEVRSLITQEVLLSRQLYKSNDPAVLQAWQELWQKLNQEVMPYLENYLELRRAMVKLIGSPVRASSLVEMINSLLRRFQQIKRHPSQEFLYLAALHYDMKPFSSGCKRQGRSPFQILGVDLGTDNWLELLRTYELAS